MDLRLVAFGFGMGNVRFGIAAGSSLHEDKHKAPTPLRIHPLSLQDETVRDYRVWSSKFIGMGASVARDTSMRVSKIIRVFVATVGAIILSVAKDIGGWRIRPFAALRVTIVGAMEIGEIH